MAEISQERMQELRTTIARVERHNGDCVSTHPNELRALLDCADQLGEALVLLREDGCETCGREPRAISYCLHCGSIKKIKITLPIINNQVMEYLDMICDKECGKVRIVEYDEWGNLHWTPQAFRLAELFQLRSQETGWCRKCGGQGGWWETRFPEAAKWQKCPSCFGIS